MTRIDHKLEQACINSAREHLHSNRFWYWTRVANRWFYKLPPYERPPWRKHTPKRKWQVKSESES